MSDTVPRMRDFSQEPKPPSSKREQHSGEPALQAGVSELTELARRALEGKRRKECLALTSAILKIDRDNEDAKVMQSWIRSGLEADIKQAYTLIRSTRFSGAREPCERAHFILQDVLDVDPENEDAQILLGRITPILQDGAAVLAPEPKPSVNAANLHEAVSSSNSLIDSPAQRAPSKSLRYVILFVCAAAVGAAVVVLLNRNNPLRDVMGVVNTTPITAPGSVEVSVDNGIRVYFDDKYVGAAPVPPLSVAPGVHKLRYELDGVEVGSEQLTVVSGKTVTNSEHVSVGRLELLVVPATGAEVRIDGRPAIPVPEYVDVKAGKHRLTFMATGFQSRTLSATVDRGGRSYVKAVLTPALPPALPPTAPLSDPVAKVPQLLANGFLAISSPYPVDIIIDDKHVGSTPTTLELPPGSHTAEYRYNGLTKRMVHVVESTHTTRVSVTFDEPQ